MTIFLFLIIARWIHFASVFALFGCSLFWFYAVAGGSLAGARQLPQAFAATRNLLRAAAIAAAVSGVGWLGAILVNMTSDFGSLIDPQTWRLFFFETGFGAVSILRLGLLAAALSIVILPWRDCRSLKGLAAISGLLLVSQAWLGHAAEGGAGLYGAAMIATYGAHALAAGAWVGGLPPLLFALSELRRGDPQCASAECLNILSRYSAMAMAAVAAIVASGLGNAAFRVGGSFGKLFDTSYGDALFAKTILAAAMLALACFNRFVAPPKLRASPLQGMTQMVKLAHSVAFELALGVFVLGAAAVLGITPPPQ
ncbi:MAG: CopD family protein [Methylocella sp.]